MPICAGTPDRANGTGTDWLRVLRGVLRGVLARLRTEQAGTSKQEPACRAVLQYMHAAPVCILVRVGGLTDR